MPNNHKTLLTIKPGDEEQTAQLTVIVAHQVVQAEKSVVSPTLCAVRVVFDRLFERETGHVQIAGLQHFRAQIVPSVRVLWGQRENLNEGKLLSKHLMKSSKFQHKKDGRHALSILKQHE